MKIEHWMRSLRQRDHCFSIRLDEAMSGLRLNGSRSVAQPLLTSRQGVASPPSPPNVKNPLMSEPSAALTGVFLALHISGGIVGLPVAVFTIIASKQVSRHPTLINFCITWFISSLIYTLLCVEWLASFACTNLQHVKAASTPDI